MLVCSKAFLECSIVCKIFKYFKLYFLQVFLLKVFIEELNGAFIDIIAISLHQLTYLTIKRCDSSIQFLNKTLDKNTCKNNIFKYYKNFKTLVYSKNVLEHTRIFSNSFHHVLSSGLMWKYRYLCAGTKYSIFLRIFVNSSQQNFCTKLKKA